MNTPRADQVMAPTCVLSATSLADLARLRAAHPSAVLVGGGTLVVPSWLNGPVPDSVIRVSGVRENRRRQSGRCGAAVTLAQVHRDTCLPNALREAAGSVGGPALRAMATVGGNVAAATPGCLGVALHAVRAKAVILLPEAGVTTAERELDEVVGRAESVIVEFRWPDNQPSASALRKVAIRATCGQVIVTVAASWIGSHPGAIAVGGTGLTPRRLFAAERAWTAQAKSTTVVNAAAAASTVGDVASAELTALELADVRLGDKAYYRSAVGTLVGRTVAACQLQVGNL